jgi:hypothetical protein
VIVSQGTRQKSSRNFGIRLASTTLDIFKVGWKSAIEEKEKIKIEDRKSWTNNALRPLKIRKYLKWWRPQRKIPCQLFTKNTAPCELVRGCIWGDA